MAEEGVAWGEGGREGGVGEIEASGRGGGVVAQDGGRRRRRGEGRGEGRDIDREGRKASDACRLGEWAGWTMDGVREGRWGRGEEMGETNWWGKWVFQGRSHCRLTGEQKL